MKPSTNFTWDVFTNVSLGDLSSGSNNDTVSFDKNGTVIANTTKNITSSNNGTN